jgi:transcriptional regulator with XRE-family HTH domain
MDNKKLLGKRIKEIRKHKGLTQEQLSEMINIETGSLSGIESGRFFPSLHILDKMSNVLDVELVEFFKFSTIDIPQDLETELENIIKTQSKENKILIYKILKSIFSVV